MSGRLSIVATPIGNLEDLTFRALRLIKEADFVICEDTRVTQVLLNKHEIKKELVSYHQHSRIQRVEEIIERLKRGQNAVLVSDAGTPGISDPGNLLVARAVEAGLQVEPIPGPSSLTALLSVAGLATDRFRFLGFLPHKKGRQTIIDSISQSAEPSVFFESPHRIIKTLHSLVEALGPDAWLVVGRELTKKFEEIIRGRPADVLAVILSSPEHQKGEFVVLVGRRK